MTNHTFKTTLRQIRAVFKPSHPLAKPLDSLALKLHCALILLILNGRGVAANITLNAYSEDSIRSSTNKDHYTLFVTFARRSVIYKNDTFNG